MIQYDPHRWLDHFFDIRGSMVREMVGGGRFDSQKTCPNRHSTHAAYSCRTCAPGLLREFRTNASYDRFWEARKLWGGMVNECRNLARGARMHFGHDQQLMERIARWTGAFPYASMNTLRGVDGIGAGGDGLPPNEVAAVVRAQHPALAVAQNMSACLIEARQRGYVSDYMLTSLELPPGANAPPRPRHPEQLLRCLKVIRAAPLEMIYL